MATTRTETKAGFSIPSIIAIIAALVSFGTGAFWGFILAMVAIVCGVLGVMLSLSPNVRGGFVSILSLVVAGVAIIVAAIKALSWIF
ncbi:MAG TPA: hypothetical protein VN673_08125 [Clostridia bacterium]|nr:hypothetical protein [Clostridia bacterium]